MQQLTSYSGLFEGRDGNMIFCHDIKSLEENKFFLAGRLVGMSLIQGGPGMCCLHPLVYKLMCHSPFDLTSFEINDIVDCEFVEVIKQVLCNRKCVIENTIHVTFVTACPFVRGILLLLWTVWCVLGMQVFLNKLRYTCTLANCIDIIY